MTNQWRYEMDPRWTVSDPYYWVAYQYVTREDTLRWYARLFYERDSAIEYLDSFYDSALNDMDGVEALKYNIPGY